MAGPRAAGARAGVGLLLSIIGVAASARQVAVERLREVGVRVALGAPPASVTRLLLKRILVVSLAAVVFGLYVDVMSAAGLQTVLFDMDTSNTSTLFAAASLLFLTVITAAYLPLRRAASVDPLEILRSE